MKRRKIPLYIMLYCIFCFTVGQFIPIYFKDHDLESNYYVILFVLTMVTVIIQTYKVCSKYCSELSAIPFFVTLFVGGITFFVTGIITFLMTFTSRGTADVYYVQKDDNDIKIVSSYIDQGALGERGYTLVFQRPFLHFFYIETTIDTTTLDKKKWIKAKSSMLNYYRYN